MTTNLTSDEREQRLKEIRARRGRAMPQATHYINDVGFLLSLIDSEAAGDDTDYKKLARELALIVDVGTSDDPGTALSKLRKVQHDTATSMRDLCVEKLGSVCDEYKADLFSTDDEIYKASLGFAVDALDRAIAKISSLTLDQVEQKRK